MDYQAALDYVSRAGTTPLLILSRTRIRENYRALRSALPRVDLYYALKANPLPAIVEVLRKEGASFDVCTNGEIGTVSSCGVTGDRCLHTHPIKRESDLRCATEFGITTFVVDNEAELDKLHLFADRIRILVRLAIQNPACPVNLSHKFGVLPEEAPALIEKAVSLGISVEGLAFHVGSQNENVLKYIEALDYCRDICRHAALTGTALSTIDIGGGFPVDYLSPTVPIQRFCQPVNEYLEQYFTGYRIIAEPGRFICGSAVTLATRIIGKSIRNGVRWYYLDEGLYGSFSGKLFDHAEYPMMIPRGGERMTSTLAGPTCDSIDVPYENIALPELEIGDILLFGSMGAYTNASATEFNGFPKAAITVVP